MILYNVQSNGASVIYIASNEMKLEKKETSRKKKR